MQITLHEAANNVRQLLDLMDPETGELPPEFEQARAVVATKAVAVAAYVLEIERQTDSVEAYAKELMDRVKAAKKKQAWLRQYLASHMAACDITEIRDDRGLFTAKLDKGHDESVEVFDAAQLPGTYMREVPAKFEPDKMLIKQSIKDGTEVPGARLVKKDRLTVK